MISWLSVVSGVISGICLIDMVSYLVAGTGIVSLICDGEGNPVVLAIAEHIADVPDWAFYVICAVSVVVLSAIMCLAVMSSIGYGGCKHER